MATCISQVNVTIYNVTITHPDKDAGLVSVRAIPAVSEKRGEIRNGEKFTAELDFRPSGDVWARIINYEANPLFNGLYCALVYGGKNFATWEEIMPAQFARVKHCSESPVTGYQRYMTWRKSPNGTYIKEDGRSLPSCFKYPFKNETYLFLDRPREQWWFDRVVESANGSMTQSELMTAWKNLTAPDKAFTNVKPKEAGGLGYLMGDTKKLRLEPVICTGAIIKLVGTAYAKGDGYNWQSFEVVDMLKNDYKSMTWQSHWWIIQSATVSMNVGTGNGERINPFPKMKGDRRSPYFLWAKGTNVASIRADWLEYLGNVDKPAYPYMPERVTADIDFWA